MFCLKVFKFLKSFYLVFKDFENLLGLDTVGFGSELAFLEAGSYSFAFGSVTDTLLNRKMKETVPVRVPTLLVF